MPIGHITNGVHVNTWLAPQMRLVYDRHLGAGWAERGGDTLWEAIERVDDGELWEAHQTLKTRLIAEVRRRAVQQAERRGEPPAVVAQMRRAAEPRRADHRVRSPVRHLQTREPAAAGSRGAERPRQRSAQAGAADLRRQVAPAGHPRQDRAPAGRAPDARSALHREDRLRRGLRHRRRPASRARRGRVAEQPAAPAGGVRHERSESRPQWRPQPVGARRLVGRGL